MGDPRKNRMSVFVDDLQARGRYTFTRVEIARVWESSDVALEAALRRLKQRGRIVRLRRGFYVIVPLEYREAGCPPASWFIDDLMRFLDQPYYVGLLSAAAIHGAAHQQPMVFQVITDRPVRPVKAGRVRVAFHKSRHVAAASVAESEVQTETGMMRVSSPEATAYDLIRSTAAAGYLNNVVTVLKELAETLNPATLVKLAPNYATSEVQRLGYLLELLGESKLAKPLAALLDGRQYRPVLLVPGQARGSAWPVSGWRIIPNATVEADF